MVSLRLNPEYGWKGSAKNHVACLDQERKKRMAKAGIKGVIEGGQQAPQEAPERDPDTLDMFRVNPREAPTGCLRSNPRSEARAHLRKLRLQCSKARAKASPSELRARLLFLETARSKSRSRSASGGPPGRSPRGRRLGEEHPSHQPGALGSFLGVKAKPLRGRCASLDPHPLRQCPSSPCAGLWRVFQ